MSRKPGTHQPLDPPQERCCEVCDETFTAYTELQVCCGKDCYRRHSRLLREYGISVKEWRALLHSQDGRCGICHALIGEDRHTATDHDHKTGIVRGLLCRGCNTGLGKLGDTPESLETAQRYMLSRRDLLGELLAA